MKRREFFFTLAGGVAIPSAAAVGQDKEKQAALEKAVNSAIASDPILTAIGAEIERFRRGAMLGEAPYHVAVTIEDAEAFTVAASLGALYPASVQRFRPVRVSVRVGDPSFDNTNSIYSDYSSATRFDLGRLPLDNTVLALRHELWLALDRAYRTAVEAIGRKRAAVRGITISDPLPDFWQAPPLFRIEPPSKMKIDREYWSRRVKALSAIFAADPLTTASDVEFNSSTGTVYTTDSTPVIVRVPDNVVLLRARGVRQAPDGMVVYDGTMMAALDPAQMPPEDAQRAAVEQVAKNIRELSAAPIGEAYTGPVLFEGVAAAQIIAQIWGDQLGVNRKPVAEPGRSLPIMANELESRLNAKVLPEWASLVDDPTATSLNGTPLIGHYAVDLEGVAAQKVELVQNGVLKSLLVSRQPIKGISGSNGHARLPASFGLKTPRISNLQMSVRGGIPAAELRKKALEMAAQLGRPYLMVVRKVDFPSFAPPDELRRIGQRTVRTGAGRPIAPPLLAYRVFADGREELVRGVRFRGMGLRSFRDLAAAGDTQHVHNYIDNGAPLSMVGAGSYVIGCSVAAPALLFEEAEFEVAADDLAKPPIVPPPTSA
jgi:hypothetical protein